MIQFLVHEKADNVGVATVDIKAGEKAKGLYMDSQKPVQVKALQDIPLGTRSPWPRSRRTTPSSSTAMTSAASWPASRPANTFTFTI